MTLHHNFPRMRGLTTVNATTDPTALVAQISDAVTALKKKQTEELGALNTDISKINGELDRVNQQFAAMKIGGSTAPGVIGNGADEAAALADFGRTGSHFNASLSSDDLSKGGATVFPVISNDIQQRTFAQSALARLSRMESIDTGDSFVEPWDIGDVGAAWVGESEARPAQETPDFHLLTVPLAEVYTSQLITQRLLDDSSYNLGSWLASRISDKFGRISGAAFMAGDGVGKPRGLTTYPRTSDVDAQRPWATIQALFTGVSGDFATATSTISPGDILIDAVYALKAEYRSNATWLMNSKTAGIVRKFKDTDGRFLWADSIAAGQPSTLLGYPVEIDEYAPDIATDAPAIWFGDFAQGYIIVERPDLRLLRDPFTSKPNVVFYAYRRVGGGLQNSEAVKAVVFGTDPA